MSATWLCRLKGGPRRVNHAAVLMGRYMFMIGGYYTGLHFHDHDPIDVRIFSLDDMKWNIMRLYLNDSPFMRYGHTTVVYENDIYLWGGRNDLHACDKLYKLDIRKRKWFLIETTGDRPTARDGHAACLMGSKMYIFGGYLDEPHNVFATGLFCIDLNTMIWQFVRSQGVEPECRDFHSIVALNGKLYLFGGRGTNTPPFHSDSLNYPEALHVWEESTKTWSTRPRGTDGPIGRRSLSMFVHRDDIYMFGGFNANVGAHFHDLYRYSPCRDQWVRLRPHGRAPCPRRRQSCVVAGSRVYVYGGTSPKAQNDDINDDETNLRDHNDLYILDLEPTLRTLALKSVIDYQLDYTVLTSGLTKEICCMDPRINRTPNRSEDDGPVPALRRRR